MYWLLDPFRSEFMVRALIATVITGVVAPVVGTWVVLRRMANLGDAMAHGTLAGVGLAYAAGVSVLVGAIGAGLVIALLLLAFSANRRLGQETVITVIGTALFALGVVVISRLDTGVELSHFLFGRVLTVTWGDVWLALGLGGAAVLWCSCCSANCGSPPSTMCRPSRWVCASSWCRPCSWCCWPWSWW